MEHNDIDTCIEEWETLSNEYRALEVCGEALGGYLRVSFAWVRFFLGGEGSTREGLVWVALIFFVFVLCLVCLSGVACVGVLVCVYLVLFGFAYYSGFVLLFCCLLFVVFLRLLFAVFRVCLFLFFLFGYSLFVFVSCSRYSLFINVPVNRVPCLPCLS